MAYDPDRNLGPNPTNPTDYRTTVVERESSGVAWVVIGLLFAAIVAAIFFLVRPGGDATTVAPADPAILAPADDPLLAPADPAVNMAPADDLGAAPADVAPAGDAGALPADETAPAPVE